MGRSFLDGAVARAEVLLHAYGPYGVSSPTVDARDAIADLLQYVQSKHGEVEAILTLERAVRYWKNGFVD